MQPTTQHRGVDRITTKQQGPLNKIIGKMLKNPKQLKMKMKTPRIKGKKKMVHFY